MMLGIELVKDRDRKTPAPKEANIVRDQMRKRGVLIGVGGVAGCTIRFQPPLVINEDQTKKAIDLLDTCLGLVS